MISALRFLLTRKSKRRWSVSVYSGSQWNYVATHRTRELAEYQAYCLLVAGHHSRVIRIK